MAVTKRVRFEVMRRDGNACRYCGAMAPEVKLTIDHVMPIALGGDDQPSNLVTACADCNAGKTSTIPDAPLVAEVAEVDLRLANALRQAAAEIIEREAPTDEEQDYLASFQKEWNRWGVGSEGARRPLELPSNWRASILTFYRQGLPAELLTSAVDTAMSNRRVDDPFRYSCGIAWRRIREIQERAAQLMAHPAIELGPECPECGIASKIARGSDGKILDVVTPCPHAVEVPS